jgi:alcohol dehydrogenase class IV
MFALKVFLHRCYMVIFKYVVMVLPYKWPTTFDGAGSAKELCKHIAAEGHKKVLIVTDAMLVQLGLIDPIKAELDAQGVESTIYDGVKPDPTVDQIEAGFDMYKAENCDGLLAIGGGSSIDAAKVIGARAKNNKPIRKMAGLFRVFRGMAPLYAIPTTAGTGSEVTIAAVVSDPEAQRKLPIMDLKIMPTACALDGTLMTGLPAPITSATGMDALTHAVEAYISEAASGKTDALAIEAAKLIMANLETAVADGANVEARQAMTSASSMAGKAFTQAGVGYVHAIAHNFGALYHTPHGLANAIVMPYVLDFSLPKCASRLADLARACNIGSGSDEELAKAFIARIREMNAKFNIPTHLDALKAEDIPQIAKAALDEARFTYAVPRYLDQKGCEALVAQILPS